MSYHTSGAIIGIGSLIASQTLLPGLGRRLQMLRAPGEPYLDVPSRRGWRGYIDVRRYRPEATRYIFALRIIRIAVSAGLIAGFCLYFWT